MTYLPYWSRDLLNRPHLISESGALGVLSVMGPRLNVSGVFDVAGRQLDLPVRAAAFDDEGEGEAADGGLFDFDPETGIAKIPIEGELVHRFGFLSPISGLTGYDGIKLKLLAAVADPVVLGILLDIHSPGGMVPGADGLAELIFLAREAKPIIALVNEQALSAAYWLASAADQVIVPATGETGSIGVLMVHVDHSRQLDMEGVTVTLIHAGRHKVDGEPFHPLPEAVEQKFQAVTEKLRLLFATKVARNRGLTVDAVLETEAEIFMGADGEAVGLVDDVGSEDELLVEFAARLARPESMALLPG